MTHTLRQACSRQAECWSHPCRTIRLVRQQSEQQVPDADKVLQDGEEVRLGRGVHHQVLHQLKTLVDIVQLQSDIVKPGDQIVNATLVY